MNKLVFEILEIRNGIEELKNKKDILVSEKIKLEKELTDLNNKVRISGRLPNREYNELSNRQCKIKSRIAQIAEMCVPIKREISLQSTKETALMLTARETNPKGVINLFEVKVKNKLIENITRLRNEYLLFSEDSTRISSMRIMSSQFANKLTDILKTELETME